MTRSSKLQSFIDSYPTRKFKKGNIIIYQGEVTRSSYVIKEGAIKAYSINTQGEERIVRFYAAGDIFPAPWAVDASASAPYYYESLNELLVHVVPQADFQEKAKEDVTMMGEITDYYIAAYANAMMRISALEQAKATEKLTYTLFYLLQGHGKHLGGDLHRINLSLTQQMIASLIGLTRETTANELLRLKKNGVLSYKSQRYIVNRKKLLAILGEESLSSL